MKKLFFVLLISLAGAALMFAASAAHPPGGIAAEAVFTGNEVTAVNPVTAALEKAPIARPSSAERAGPAYYMSDARTPIDAAAPAPDYHLLC